MGSKFLLVGLLFVGGAQRGCFGYESVPPEDEVADPGDTTWVPLPGAVDLLVVVDNSNSMAQEQANLADSFSTLVSGLVSPPDLDGDGAPDYPPVTDLHVGIVSTDMGTGGYAVQTCRDAYDGDDGILRNTPSGAVTGCRDVYPSFLEYAEGGDTAALAADFACMATLGTGGCGFEQQLGAVRSALTVHQDGANEGFLREGSVLAVLVVSDEDDCTIADAVEEGSPSDIFNTGLPLGPLNLRCYNYPEYAASIDGLVQDVLAARPGHPERVILGGVLGTPPDSGCNVGDMSTADFDCLLDHPAMQEVIDDSAEGKGERLTPSCDVSGLGEAFPPRRLVQFLRGVQAAGGSANVQSICQNDWDTALSRIAREIRSHVAE